MDTRKTHYPDFDVMDAKEAWDAHTQDIVVQRLKPTGMQALSLAEIQCLTPLCAQLLDESKGSILDFVVQHFDNKITSGLGEGQRKASVPKESVFILQGLAAIDVYCESQLGKRFCDVTPSEQGQLVTHLFSAAIDLRLGDVQVDAKEWITKILTEAVSAYYSHPAVWSDIGYAGPAYPRGYVRTERGLTDAWEAKEQHGG